MKTIVEIRQSNYTMEVEMAGLLKGMPSSALSALLDRLDQLEQSNQDLADQVSDLQTTVDNFSAKELPVGTVIELNFIPTNINTLMGYGVWVEDTARAGRVGVGRGTVTDTRGVPSTFTVGAVGGETAHVQAEAEVGIHHHGFRILDGSANDPDISIGYPARRGGSSKDGTNFATQYTVTNQVIVVPLDPPVAANVMQPYIVRTYWVRTA